MKIAIISDSHDNIPNIDTMLEYCSEQNISTMIHCGDVCAPGVMKYIGEKFSGDVHLCYGNVDGDREKMEELAAGLPNLHIYGDVGKIEIDGRKLAFVHYPDQARQLAEQGKYDSVFHGHDHKAWEQQIGKTTLRNPGTLAGLFAKPTFAVYNTETNGAQLVLIEQLLQRKNHGSEPVAE